MVNHSGPLVSGVVKTLDACENNDRDKFDEGMSNVVSALRKVNQVMNGKSSTGMTGRSVC